MPYQQAPYGDPYAQPYAPPPKKSHKGLIITLVVIGVVLLGAVAVGVFVLASYAKDNVIATDLKLGDCITEVPTSTRVLTLPTVDCAQPHGGEVYAVLTMPDGGYPGASAIDEWQNKCPDELQSFSPEAMADDSVGVFVLYPTQETWNQGDRAVTCIATLEPKRAGSIKG
ncbi:MAG: hypothetical protein JWR34_3844 [Mycobacterium sp.]|jgi:hypothetical protein|nr:hypothetical protein [Mycobacterium sp.]